ncbi:hypothetical protein JOQ06_027976 [Pogonophryne albipinna]|uniref:FISNA domain-containing protein n=1 Tax=Pogonophryne albipinna TaxID=1090488 RepID=A0AAD6A8K5_9TELE|nr:hypothetical protein JOQ06_027976 [Pogonophryne albipinna]
MARLLLRPPPLLEKGLPKCPSAVRRRTDQSETLLNSIFTELYITQGQSEEVNTQHEVRQLEAASKKETLHDTPIKCQDIFKASPDQQTPIRAVLTNGVAGVGKSLLSAEVHSGLGRGFGKPRCQSGDPALLQGAEPDQR